LLEKMNLQNIKFNWHNLSATRIVTSTLGILVGLAGIEHGIFEVLQGDIMPSDILIDAIGPAQRFWEYGTERALTVIPNFFITGILAIFFGILVTIWAVMFIQRRYGAQIFFLLAIILWLVGGGFAPIFFSIIAVITATRINKPLIWWRTHLPDSIRNFLVKLWPGSLIALVVIFWIGVEIAIFGYPLLWFFPADFTYSIQFTLALIMIGLTLISVFSALAYEIHK
jgi:hypothetical protein